MADTGASGRANDIMEWSAKTLTWTVRGEGRKERDRNGSHELGFCTITTVKIKKKREDAAFESGEE